MGIDIPSFILGKEKGGSGDWRSHIKTYEKTLSNLKNTDGLQTVVIGTPVSLLQAVYDGRGFGYIELSIDNETQKVPIEVTTTSIDSGLVLYQAQLTFMNRAKAFIDGGIESKPKRIYKASFGGFDYGPNSLVNSYRAFACLEKASYDANSHVGTWSEVVSSSRSAVGIGDSISYVVTYWDD